MRLPFLLALTLMCCSSAAFAQTEGRVSVGLSVTQNGTPDSDVASATSVGLLIRLNPRPGWGPAAALNWYRADLHNPAGGDDDFARLQVRPLMGGVSYNVTNGSVLTSFSVVGGPSFNKARFNGSYTARAGESIDADNSFAIRPGVGATWTVAPRVAIVGFGGYMLNRPGVSYRNQFGVEVHDRWKADSVVLSVGAVYSLF